MAESRAGQYHSDSIITTIYEGTSEIQASFALKEMSKGAMFAALEDVRAELESAARATPRPGAAGGRRDRVDQQVVAGADGGPAYALLNAKRLCEMVIDVLVAAELLQQAALSEEKFVLATTFIHRRMLAVEMNARASAAATRRGWSATTRSSASRSEHGTTLSTAMA